MDAPRMHSHETSPLHNIAQVLQHSGFYPKYGVCPKFVPKNVFSLHTLRGAEEYYGRERFPECGGLLHSRERDSETVAAQFLSGACSVSTMWRTTVLAACPWPLPQPPALAVH